LGIRGSVVAGIVGQDVPTFLFVGEGTAVFTNDAGTTHMQSGSAIAVPSRKTVVIRPGAMPPAVVAQALQAIDRRLQSGGILGHRPPASVGWLRRSGAANLLPAAEQATRGVAAARGAPLPAGRGSPRLDREINLLVEGNRRGLFDGAQTARTADQQAFLAQASRAMPQARTAIARSTAQAAALHHTANLAGAELVIRGVATAAPTAEVLTRVANAAARTNPAAASAIRRSAIAAYHGSNRAREAAQLGGGTGGAPESQRRAAGESRSRFGQPGSASAATAGFGAQSTHSHPPARSAAGRIDKPQGQAAARGSPGRSGPRTRSAVSRKATGEPRGSKHEQSQHRRRNDQANH
jgi:hypothetical protein